MTINLKRHERIVRGSDQQGRHVNALEKLIRRLRGLVIRGVTESEERRGETVVEIVDGMDIVETVDPKHVRHETVPMAHPVLHTDEEAPLVEKIIGSSKA